MADAAHIPASLLKTASADDSVRPARVHPVLLGGLLCTLLAVVMTSVFQSQYVENTLSDARQRDVIVHGMALADIVGGIEAAGSKESAAKLDQLLTTWQSEFPDVSDVRVLRLNGAQLLASTNPVDAAKKALPRRLVRDEKEIFDLAKELSAAVETNRDEGVSRKRQILLDPVGADSVNISLPYFTSKGGEVAGLVQLTKRVEPVESRTGLVGAILSLAIVAVLSYIACAVLGPRSPPGSRPWMLTLVVGLIFSLVFFVYARTVTSAATELSALVTDNIASAYQTIKEQATTIGGRYSLAISSETDNRWDADEYQRPYGVIDASGAVIPAAFGELTASRAAPFVRGLWGNWVAGLILLGFIGAGYGRQVRHTISEHRHAYLYVMPAILGMLVLVFFPFFYGITLSFTDQTIFTINEPITEVFAGLKNYVEILGDFNVATQTAQGWVFNYSNFYWTLFISVSWTISNVAIGLSIGMTLALALNTKGLRFRSVYRVLLILPWAIPNYITALIWKGMFHPQFGVINQAIQIFGGSPVAWFDGVFSSFMTGLATNGWLSFPFMMVVVLGALQSISQDMYEAATVEGASRWQQFRYITLPSLKPTVIPAVIISVIWTFNMFNVIYLVSGGAPAGANEILITEAYKIAFEKYQIGYSAAYSVVIFMILLTYGVFQTKMTKATEANA
jgi:arabinogalactan oligomer/maltooligosaccharide transport system permease protein